MKFLLVIALLCTSLCGSLFAQAPSSIKGVIADTANNSKLQNASISILNAKDSTLYKFARANANGAFQISPMKKGNFILLLTYPDYADYVSFFSLDSIKTSLDVGQINMKLKATLLNEVIIRGAAAIKIKGDTTEFNAASYTIQPNDKVEDLLKKLPGIQVDKDGKITAQGKSVPKVLVDGEEFFGDDPTLVTKNLRADMVDKVQLYEKKSDQATFTGVDDGQKTQTINIKLKEDKKNGYFGKVMGGIGTDGFYQGQLMYNQFKGKQKFSVYGTSSNTGKTGLGWEDSDKYGSSGNENIQFIDGGMYMTGGGGDEISSRGGTYYGEGIPVANNGGAHYDTKWGSDKHTLNTNYKVGDLAVDILKNTIEESKQENDVFTTITDKTTANYNFRQKMDVAYTIKLDTTSNLKITADGTLRHNTSRTFSSQIGRRADNSIINSSERTNDNKGKEEVFNVSAFYTKKLKKVGRNISLSLSEYISDRSGEGYLIADNEFFNRDSTIKSSEKIDQFKTNTTTSTTFNSNLTYAEPFSKKFSLLLNYGMNVINSNADKKAFNTSAPGRYDILDTEYSNDFEVTQVTNQAGAIFSFKTAKTALSWGTKVNAVSFDQYDSYADVSLKRNFINWMPQARYQYRFSQQRSFSFNYSGNTTQPSVSQLQPVKVNDDPFNLVLGNEDLKPSYNNYLGAYYNSYKVLSGESIYLSMNFGFVNNQIVNKVTTDTTNAKSIIQAINLEGKTPTNYSIYLDYGRKIKALDMNVGIGLNAYSNTNYSYVKNILNQTVSSNYSLHVNLYKSKEKKYDFSLYGGPTYTIQKTSIDPVNSNGWGAQGSANFLVYLPGKFQISSDANYNFTGETATFQEEFSQFILNASLNKTFFKTDNLKLSLSGNDLLNQNRGFRRSVYGNVITQNSYNNIKRYFMFSATWDFNKMGGIKK